MTRHEMINFLLSALSVRATILCEGVSIGIGFSNSNIGPTSLIPLSFSRSKEYLACSRIRIGFRASR